MEEARDAAVAEATAKATQYAEASGQELGDVLTLREVHAKPVPTPVYAELAGAALKRDAVVGPDPGRQGEGGGDRAAGLGAGVAGFGAEARPADRLVRWCPVRRAATPTPSTYEG